MDTEFCTQTQTVPSSLSTATEISQEFSPPKIKHEDSLNVHDSFETPVRIFHRDSDADSLKLEKKQIFKIIRESKGTQTSTVPLNKDFGNYNRKEKSLGELSKRLLMMFGRIDQCVISLDTVTQQLGVERRRIYDIINILESLGVVYRKGKNSYQWKGLKSIHETIKKLQRDNCFKYDISQEDLESDDEDNQKPKSAVKREKSLGLLSTGFIKLFLSWKGTISLEQAGRKLSSENCEENKIKTKIRRLYDIANVFSSLGLIKKTCLESKKPAYEWVGLTGLDAFINRLNSSSDEREIFLEHSTKNKEKAILAPEKKSIDAQQQHAFNIKSDNSAFKPRETPLAGSDNIENLLCFLLSLYNRQTPINKMANENSLSRLLFNNSLFEPTKLMKHSSSPARFNRPGMGFTTPSIRKSVSIIQRATDSDSDFSSEKKRPYGMSFSQDQGNITTSFKRRACGDLGEFESRTIKKLHTLGEFENSECTPKKSLFQNKKN